MVEFPLSRGEVERIGLSLNLDAEPDRADGQLDLAFVFGTRHLEPVAIAAGLFKTGVVGCVVLTGGINRLSGSNEANEHLKALIDQGVPRHCIIVEDESTNTLENVAFALPKMAAHLDMERIEAIVVVTKWYHCRRAIMTLKRHLPKGIRYFAKTYEPRGIPRLGWHLREEAARRVLKEWRCIPEYLRRGDIADVRYLDGAFV
jgi:uncharacterized SAM-binding protein YcdF (DUF218 family)